MVNTAFVGTDSGNGSRIDFTSFSHQRLYRDAHESDQNELSYYIDDDPHNPGTEARSCGASSGASTTTRARAARSQVLIENVEGFELGVPRAADRRVAHDLGHDAGRDAAQPPADAGADQAHRAERARQGPRPGLRHAR